MRDNNYFRKIFLEDRIGKSFVDCIQRNNVSREDLSNFILKYHNGIIDHIFSRCMDNGRFNDLSEEELETLFSEVITYWVYESPDSVPFKDLDVFWILKSLGLKWLLFCDCEIDTEGYEEILTFDGTIDEFFRLKDNSDNTSEK